MIECLGMAGVATPLSSKDYQNPETWPLLEKCLAGKAGISTEDRFRVIKLVKHVGSFCEDLLTIHVEGSLEAQKLSILVEADFGRYRAAAMRAARVSNKSGQPPFDTLPEFPPKI